MANNPPHTRSTTNDDQLSALEISTHSIRQPVKSQKEEFITVKARLDALSSAVAKISRALDAKGMRLDETNNNGDRDNGSINQNHEIGESSREQSRGTQHSSLQTRFLRLDFPHFDGENPTDGFTRLNNSFTIRELNQTRRCYWHLFICKMKPCSGTNGMSSCSQTCSGRNLLEPCASILGLLTMKILMKL